jgi:hypothetical protein
VLNTRTPILKATVTVALAAVAALTLSGCFNGFQATTNIQNTMSTGNGVQAQVGAVRIENATLVRGEGSAVTLIMTIVNVGTEADALGAVSIAGQQAVVSDGTAPIGPVEVAPGAAVPFGYGQQGAPASRWVNAYTVEIPASGFVPVQVFMERAGLAELEVLTVPPVGYYEGIAPQPPTAP